MLHPDGQYEPALIPRMIEPIVARRGRPRARLAARCPGRGARRRHAALEVRRQPLPDDDPEPDHGHRTCPRPTPATAPTRASCCSRSRSCATRSTSSFDSELLCQAAALRLPDRRGPGALPLLRGRVLGRLQGRRRLRRSRRSGPGFRLILHRHGLLRSRKFSGGGRSSTTVKPVLPGATGRRPKRAIDPLQRPRLQRRERRAADRLERVAPGLRRAAPRAPSGRRVHQHAVAGPQRVDPASRSAGSSSLGARSSSPTGRRAAAGPRGRCGAGSQSPRSGATIRRLSSSPGMWRGEHALAGRRRGRQRRRMPEPVERRAQRARRPGAACASGVRGNRSGADDQATATSRSARDGERRARARRSARPARPRRRARSSRPSQSAPVSSAGSATWRGCGLASGRRSS